MSRVAAVEISELSFSYPGSPLVIDRLSMRIESGSFALLVGSTGCGKTTLLRLLKPEIAPVGNKKGRVSVFGHTLDGMAVGQSAKLIAYVFQSPGNQLVCDKVWHELAFGLENLGTDNTLMSRRVAEVAGYFGIEHLMDRSVSSLSAGQQQLVNLASVLAMQPKLLLLDEPTAQLDPVAEKNFLHALFRIHYELETTILVATHAPEVMAEYADTCFEMSFGKVCCANMHAGDHVLLDRAAIDTYRARLRSTLDAQDASGLLGCAARDMHLACETTPDATRMQTPLAKGRFSASVAHHALVCKNLWFRYSKDGRDILRGLDLKVGRGGIHILVGGNGCGKSTLLGLAAGLYKPQHGSCKHAQPDSLFLSPQEPEALFSRDSVAEELSSRQRSLGMSSTGVRPSGESSSGEPLSMELAGAFSLDTVLGRHPYDLSYGQRQCLALVKALSSNADLLLLDEPTKGMDSAMRLQAAKLLLEHSRLGRTVLLATHDLTFAALTGDKISLVFDGKITCTEAIPDFFEGNYFYRLWPDGLVRALEDTGDVCGLSAGERH